MDDLAALTVVFELMAFMVVFFWVGFLISRLITHTDLSTENILISFGISWAVSSIPLLLFGLKVDENAKMYGFIIVPVSSFLVTYIMRNKAKNHELDQYVELKNEHSQEVKKIKVGFSWPCFFFGFFFGVPLFVRKLNVWGTVMASIDILYILLNTSESIKARNAAFIIFLSIIGLSMFLGFKANEMTAKTLIESGWEFKTNENSNVAFAKEKWFLKGK